MRKILLLWLLAASTLTQAQIINLGDLATKPELRKANARIDSLVAAIKRTGGGSTGGRVVLDSCKKGPTIEGISKITGTSAELLFDADGVPSINYVILSGDGDTFLYGDSLVNLTTNRPTFKYGQNNKVLPDGSYYLRIQGRACISKPSQRKFTIRSSVGEDNPTKPNDPSGPPVDVTPVGSDKVLGAESIKVGGRYYTYNETPELKLKFNGDGTISDVTEGLDNSGPIAKLGGQNVFYMIGYGWFETGDGKYEKFQNIKLPDGPHSIKQFVCNPSRFPNYETFKKYLAAYGEQGVNTINARMSEIFLSIKSDQKVGQGIGRDWLVVSRALNFTKELPTINWKPYNKWIATAAINKGDEQDVYRRVGVAPDAQVKDNMTEQEYASQAMTFKTHRVPDHTVLTADGAYNNGRFASKLMGSSPYSYLSEEIVENGQGGYDRPGTLAGFQASYHFARGNLDDIRTKFPNIDKRFTGIFGGYGGDDYYGLINQGLLYGTRRDYELSLTDKLYKGYGVHGWSNEDHIYYTGGSIDVRNVNAKYYFYNKIYNLPYEFIALNERLKLATKTYAGQDRESNLSIFSSPLVESFVANDQGGKVGIEQNLTGALIHFANGTMLTKLNTSPAAAWDELFTAGFWAPLVTSGIALWDAPGSTFGLDKTKIQWWSDQWISWAPNGRNNYVRVNDGDFGRYGIPEKSADGIMHTLRASPIDAVMAGMEAAWEIRNRTTKLYFISYESERGRLMVKPGSAGFHLNGFGVPNYNSFTVKDAFDQHAGIPLLGEGPEGAVLIYYNGFLSRHLSEHVKIRYAGKDYDMGEVYGRQTVTLKL